MSRMKLALALLPATLALSSGCKHDDGQASSTTTIRSGTPDGVRVTNIPDKRVSERDQAAERLASALCAHERACAAEERAGGNTEAGLLGETVCSADMKPGARRSVDAWKCSPATAQAGLDECLQAIEAEPCPEARGVASLIEQCRPDEICRERVDTRRQ